MALRNYSNTAVVTALVGGINSSDTSLVVGSTTGFPASTPYTLALDYEAATQELVEVTGVAGTTLTVTRGVDNTSAQSHANAAAVAHVISKRDVSEPNAHVNASTDVHGLAGGAAVVGTSTTQTLTNKTMSGASNTFSAIPGSAITGNFGAVVAVTPAAGTSPMIARGAASQTANLQEWQDSASTALAAVDDDGSIYTATNLRVGAVGAPDANTTVQLEADAVGDTTLVVKAIGSQTGQLAEFKSSGGTRQSRVATDGSYRTTGDGCFGSDTQPANNRLAAIAGAATAVPIIAKGAASHSANLQEWQNSAGSALATVNSSGGAGFFTVFALAATFTGSSDTTELTINGNAGQTVPLVLVQKSDGTDLFTVDNDGDVAITGNLAVSGIGQVLYSRVTANDALDASSTTLQDVAGLSVSLAASATYRFEYIILASSPSNTPDLKVVLTVPGSAAGICSGEGVVTTATGGFPHTVSMLASTGSLTTTWATGSLGTAPLVRLSGLIRTTDAGTFKAQCAQNTSDANVVTILADSHVYCQRVA